MQTSNFNINNRQRLIFVNNTKVTSLEQKNNLINLSEKYPNVVFFSEEEYQTAETNSSLGDLIHDTNLTEKNIIIGGTQYVPIRGISTKQNSVIINNQLITLTLDNNFGLLGFTTSTGIYKVEMCGIYYNVNASSAAFGEIYNSKQDGNYIGAPVYFSYPNNAEQGALENQLMFLFKIYASADSLNGVQTGPDINLYIEKNGNKLNLTNTYVESNLMSMRLINNKQSLFERSEPVNINGTTKQLIVSYVPYIYAIDSVVVHSDNIKYSVSVPSEVIGREGNAIVNPGGGKNIVIMPVIKKFEIISAISETSKDYESWQSFTALSKQSLSGSNDEQYLNMRFNLGEMIFKIVPNRYEYANSYKNIKKLFDDEPKVLTDFIKFDTSDGDTNYLKNFNIKVKNTDNDTTYTATVEHKSDGYFKITALSNGTDTLDVSTMTKFNYEISAELKNNISTINQLIQYSDTIANIYAINKNDIVINNYYINTIGSAHIFVVSQTNNNILQNIQAWLTNSSNFTTTAILNQASDDGKYTFIGGQTNYVTTSLDIFNPTVQDLYIVDSNLHKFINACTSKPLFGITLNNANVIKTNVNNDNNAYFTYTVNTANTSGSTYNLLTDSNLLLDCYIVNK